MSDSSLPRPTRRPRQSSHTGTSAKAKRIRGRLTGPQIQYRYLRTTGVQWDAYRIEYLLTALLEAWHCPDDQFPALMAEHHDFLFGVGAGAQIFPFIETCPSSRAMLLTMIETALKDALAERRAWPAAFLRLQRAIGGDHGQQLEAARQALDEFSRAQAPA